MRGINMRHKIKLKFSFWINVEYNVGTRSNPVWEKDKAENEWEYVVDVNENDFIDFLFETKKIEENPYGWSVVKKVIEYSWDMLDVQFDDDFIDWLKEKHYDDAYKECEEYMGRFTHGNY